MENLDIIILSTIVTTLFVIFIGVTVKELMKVANNPPQQPSVESGPRADMIKFIGRLFDTPPPLTKEDVSKKIDVYNTVYKTIADMESGGVYFPEEVKTELKMRREELRCEYSNLPSVKAYDTANQ